ncbi:MAG: hypothetical protein CME06_00485 [Gemmatimonadetes bacterium]|nr:hypothetical protein [Gemmatimonadota bacterium]
MIPLGEQRLRRVVRGYADHHHLERHHQGIGGRPISPSPSEVNGTGEIRRRERLGGMLNFYYREAA